MIPVLLMIGMLQTTLDTPPFYENKMDLLHFIAETGTVHPVVNTEQWQTRRHHILENMQLVMGKLPEIVQANPPVYEVVEDTAFPRYIRQTIRYKVDAWDEVPALLFLPTQGVTQDRKFPAVLCLHPTSPIGKRVCAGEGEKTNRNYAQELAERGYITLAPDYPGFGDYVEARKRLYEEGYVSCTMKGIVNHIRAIDLLQSLTQVDPERIGCIGHSLGGHNTLFVSAFDKRIKVAVTSCGFTQFPKYMNGDLTGWTHDGYMPRIDTVYGKDPEQMPFDFSEVIAAIAPRSVFVCAPVHDANFDMSGVKDAIAAAQPVFDILGGKDKLQVAYPDAEHDFPTETRHAAYAYMDDVLGRE